MSLHKYLLGAVSVAAILAAGQANAQTAASAEQIASMQKQIKALEKNLESMKKTQAAQAAMPVKGKSMLPNVVATMPGGRPTICTADGLSCVAITGRLHYDVGGYSYSPNSASTNPQDVHNGQNARRARLGVIGTFGRDWEYSVVFDGGGTTDGDVILNNAWLAYKGFKNAVIEGGYMDVPYTLDESISSNNIMFMERSASQVIATGIAAGDNRAAFGGRVFGDRWWAGAYLTGPSTGVTNNHSARQPIGSTYRVAGLPIHNETGSLLVGFDALLLHDAGATGTVADQIKLSDRIEVRIDPATSSLLSATINNTTGARVLSGEAAVNIGSFYAQGEYFNYNIERTNGLGNLDFNGGYIQASYVLTGEQRKYSKSAGAFGGIKPKSPVDITAGNWGAWEIAARYTNVNLNDLEVLGGKMSNTTVGLNWYVNDNVRFMFNYIHGDVEKFNAAGKDTGAKYDAFAMRTQIAF